MRRTNLVVIVGFIAGLVAGLLLSPLRFGFVQSQHSVAIYRFDHLTGRVDVAAGLGDYPWRTIPPRIEDLSDKELLDLANKK